MENTTKKFAIVGAGVMGGEIAYVAAAAGISVVLKDIEQRFLDAGMDHARAIFAFRVKRRRITEEEMNSRLALITTTLDYAPMANAEFVIEAVPENMDLKRRVFAELESVCAESAVLASNTSALSITGIAEALKVRGRVVGMHFFNPVSMMRLVEVVRGRETSDDTAARTSALSEAMGKTPVVVADAPGFVVNRLLCAAMLEAIRIEREGLAGRAAIDSLLVKPDAGLPIGLFKMADQLGIDLIGKVMKILEDGLGERFHAPDEIRSLLDSCKLGVKTGEGFYKYGDAPSPAAVPADAPEEIVPRILTAVVAEAKRLAAEGVASPDDVDNAMRFGALFKKPPFAYEAEVGANAMKLRLDDYAARFGKHFKA